ncbi:hypothetical protein B484DRAFT_442846 [Ochromonadaceae sp. CCMP2298]|nr:hypothetical protein B484DRAFT_442846 [Ochromonadaceae sp. CCMP2298]|mmetsp:Transcript_30252/g.66956  ORF Transcript_30252/g.66956 Transcript_30252/m.66956 type:complete len:516 (-) Transcript_30252:98-1645(-)
MEILFSVENFEEGAGAYREISSPRTLEACLRSGLDPAELYPKQKQEFMNKTYTAQMLDIKYSTFEKKRADKIISVKAERNSIIQYMEKKWMQTTGSAGERPPSPNTLALQTKQAEMDNSNNLLEQEEKRIDALRKRQEKEMSKIVEREQTLATLQQKIKRSEEEELKKRKIHDKKVAEERVAGEKRKQQRVLELKRLEQEEAEKKRDIARRDAAVADKLQKRRLQMEQEIKKEARMNDEERKHKVEESRKKTEALMKAQEDQAEVNRMKMIEREVRIMTQLENKKEAKKEEVAHQREVATKRIAEALEKYYELHAKKKADFGKRQVEAAVRAKEHEMLERERLKKQVDDRDKRNKQRMNRLIDAYKGRSEHRKSIVDRRNMKDTVFGTVQEEMHHTVALMKFTSELKLRDKLDNVERVARMNEFKRLQTLQRIEQMDLRYEEIHMHRDSLLKKHAEEGKQSLIRKHEISDAMERMRMSNDFTLLDKLFVNKAKKGEKKGEKTEELDGDERLNQTI